MSLLCLASGMLAAQLAASTFTLAWTHSIEKIRWEEDWQVNGGGPTAPVLRLVAGRIRGSGAGMEPPADARLANGVWHYPVERDMPDIALAHSAYTAGYELCIEGRCRPLAGFLPGLPAMPEQATTIRLHACRSAATPAP